MARIRIKCVDVHQNVAWLYRNDNGSWSCALSNGTPAAFSYASVDHGREMECKFALEDAGTSLSALKQAAHTYLRPGFEIVGAPDA